MIPERDIIKALADNRLRVAEAAKALYFSKNGMHYRVDTIRRKTGLDPTDFWDMQELVRRYEIEPRDEVRTITYMERQLAKHRLNYEREKERGASEDVLENIGRKIGYFEDAVAALREKET